MLTGILVKMMLQKNLCTIIVDLEGFCLDYLTINEIKCYHSLCSCTFRGRRRELSLTSWRVRSTSFPHISMTPKQIDGTRGKNMSLCSYNSCFSVYIFSVHPFIMNVLFKLFKFGTISLVLKDKLIRFS